MSAPVLHAPAGTADAVLRGAIDLRHHGCPEIALDIRTRHEDTDELRAAASTGRPRPRKRCA